MANEPTPFDIHLYAISNLLPNFFKHGKLVEHKIYLEGIKKHYPKVYENDDHPVIQQVFDYFLEKGVFKKIGGKYSPNLLVFDNNVYQRLPVSSFKHQHMEVRHAASADIAADWFQNTLINSLLDLVVEEKVSKFSATNDWEPLPIDRENHEFATVLSSVENAIEIIEGDNGYAANDAEERNGIVESTKGTLRALKDGSPSKELIVAGLLNPLKYVAKKFSDAIMGAAAKEAVSAIMKWLSG